MTSIEIVSLIVTFVGVASFALVFTILYRTFITSSIREIKSGNRDIELIDEAIYEKQEKIKKRRKLFARVKSILLYVVIALVVPLFVFSLINKIQGNATMVGKNSIMVVASGSMSEKNEANDYLVSNNLNNQFQTYDIIVLEKVSKDELRQYDVIAYRNNEGINVIHRIISVNDDGTYTTRGDANNASDKYKPTYEDVIGRYTSKKVNTIGIFVIFLQSSPGIITIISMVYVLIMVDRLSSKLNKVQDKRIEQLGNVIEQIKDETVDGIEASFKETIYYKGYAYRFDENGFIDKNEINESEDYLKDSEKKIIKVIEDKDQSVVNQEEFEINSREEE